MEANNDPAGIPVGSPTRVPTIALAPALALLITAPMLALLIALGVPWSMLYAATGPMYGLLLVLIWRMV